MIWSLEGLFTKHGALVEDEAGTMLGDIL